MPVLLTLQGLMDAGVVRRSAEALLVFDDKEPTDVASLRTLQRLGWLDWVEVVAVDEKRMCIERSLGRLCRRAEGTFRIGHVRLNRVSRHAAGVANATNVA